jgi:hypothetical protein
LASWCIRKDGATQSPNADRGSPELGCRGARRYARAPVLMSPPGIEPFVAVTDQKWFDYLASATVNGVLDEVNFWSPQATRPMKAMLPGLPVFFRLKSPIDSIGGYGFFANFVVLGLDEAWATFREKNGDPDALRFLTRIGRYRGLDLLDPRAERAPIGCTVLRTARFWRRDRWIPWGAAEGWKPNIVQGKTETDPARASRLLNRDARLHRARVIAHPRALEERSPLLPLRRPLAPGSARVHQRPPQPRRPGVAQPARVRRLMAVGRSFAARCVFWTASSGAADEPGRLRSERVREHFEARDGGRSRLEVVVAQVGVRVGT